MYISFNYLKTLVDLKDISYLELVRKITLAGIEVEGTRVVAQGEKLIIGKVVSCNKHPDSKHLSVCSVDVGDGELNIVCGAPNVAANQKVIVALPGAYLPAIDLTIKKTTIRGIESNGMICSLLELGVDKKNLSEESIKGIEVLSNDAKVGDDPLKYLGLDDVIIELKPTPNRGDLYSLYSLAYDVAAIMNRKVLFNLEDVKTYNETKPTISVISNTPNCHYINLQKVSGIKVGPSPKWLQDILIVHNYRPVNNVVDIGNYVMLLYGQPIHLYDVSKITNNSFSVEDSKEENFLALDGYEYTIEKDDLLICAGNVSECVAGIVGSESSKVDEETKEVIIEAAVFKQSNIRRTSRRLQIFSESSARFTRGVDEKRTVLALKKVVELLFTLADAKTTEEMVTFGNAVVHNPLVELRISKTNKVLGTAYDKDIIKDVFNRLDFEYSYNDDVFRVIPPSYRKDILIEEDLIEEVVRIVGFDSVTSSLPLNETLGEYSLKQKKRNLIKNHLISNSLVETFTYSLVNKKELLDFNLLNKKDEEHYGVMSSMSEEHAYMRTSLVPSLLKIINYNQARKNDDVAIFEISEVYPYKKQKELLSIVMSGLLPSSKWIEKKQTDFYHLKGVLISILELLGIDEARLNLKRVEEDNKFLHPGKSAYIMIDKKVLGYLGQVHPQIQKEYDIEESYVLEIDLDALLLLKASKTKFIAPTIYPTIKRDISMLIENEVAVNDVVRLAKRVGRDSIASVEVFDVYEGKNVKDGYKSVAISIVYQTFDKTFTEEEIKALHTKVLEELVQKHRVEIRK